VMTKYSAVQGGHGTFSSQAIRWNKPQGSKRRDISHQLDDLAALVQHTVLTRGGNSQVVRREGAEGGFICRIVLPGYGGLTPSGVGEIVNQIRSVIFQEYPNEMPQVDVLDVRDIGMGSPVSQYDQQHILTLRVLAKINPLISPTNNPHNPQCQGNDSARRGSDDD